MGKKIRFVTDSTCDLPQELVDKYNVTVVPVFINYGNKSYADDGIELVREKYYNELPGILPAPGTSAMSAGLAEEAILKADKEADHLIIITLPAKLSGVYNAMRLGAQKLPEDRYTMIDAGNTTMGLGWQIVLGAQIAEATDGDVNAVVNALKRLGDYAHVYCVLDTLEYLRRGGRVGWAAANIGALLQIKPLLHVHNSEVHNAGKVRTFRKAVIDLCMRVRKHGELEKVAILHTNNLEGAQELKTQLQDVLPSDTITICITPSLGTHIGPGGVGVALVSKAWRNESDHAIGTGNTG